MTDLPDPIDAERLALADEAYKRFPDQTEPSEHPLGKIVVDNGSLRYAFLEGARFATSRAPRRDEPALVGKIIKTIDDRLADYDDLEKRNDLTEYGKHGQLVTKLIKRDIEFALAHPAEPQGGEAAATMAVYRGIATVTADPGDGTAKPSIEDILTRGFHSMGWSQPTLAAYEILYAIAERVTSPAHSRPAAQPGMREARLLPDWMAALSMQQQSVLVLGLRGPDGVRKHHPCKDIVRFYRGTVLKAARFGRLLDVDEKADSFMCMEGFSDEATFLKKMKAYFDTIDELPHHYHMHLMHGAQILGYKHPDDLYRVRWLSFYLECLNDSHTPQPETEQQMDERLGDWGRKQWDRAALRSSSDPDAVRALELTEQQIEAAWKAFQDCPIDLLADSDDEQKKCVVAAVNAALVRCSSPAESIDVVGEVAAERRRQVEKEGWTAEHDDQHADDEIALAALCYVYASIYDPDRFVRQYWPWDNSWWKPKDNRRNLIKAAALIIAEIERLDRTEKRPPSNQEGGK